MYLKIENKKTMFNHFTISTSHHRKPVQVRNYITDASKNVIGKSVKQMAWERSILLMSMTYNVTDPEYCGSSMSLIKTGTNIDCHLSKCHSCSAIISQF